MGYRHVDTASMYDNEAAVGAGIEASSVPRADIVVATKRWYDDLAGDDVVPAATASLDRLGLDYDEGLIDPGFAPW